MPAQLGDPRPPRDHARTARASRPHALPVDPPARPARAARRRHARRRRRQRALRARSPSSTATGRLLYAAGDPAFLTMTRSALKPFQAMPFVAAGGIERFGFSTPQVALLCASHSGEPRHVEAAADMLAKAGNAVDGPAVRHARAAAIYEARGEVPPPPPYSPLAHNCSGKHSGMLAYCVAVRPAEGELPRRTTIRCSRRSAQRGRAFHRRRRRRSSSPASTAARRRTTRCRSRGLALAFARLAARHDDAGLRRRAAGARRRDDRASGDGVGRAAQRSRADARRARRLGRQDRRRGRAGASASAARGIGIAIKVADGNKRALLPSSAAVLDAARAARRAARAELAAWCEPAMRNYRGIVTGRIVSSVVLDKVDVCVTPLPRMRNNPTRAMNFRPRGGSVAASAHRSGVPDAAAVRVRGT